MVVGSTALMAQGPMPPPKVVEVIREYVKPGKAGMAHEKTESAFVKAMANANWPTHYLGLTSLTGKSRALFLVPYDSYEAMEKDNAATAKNKALSTALDHATEADGALLDEVDQGVLLYNEKLSFHSTIDITQMRFLEATSYHVKPGHRSEWDQLVKMVMEAYDKAALGDVNWTTFELSYGGEDGTFIVFTWHKALAEIDHGMLEDKQFQSAMGADGMKKLDELYGDSVSSADNELFAVNPSMSYVSDGWIKSDPNFWKPKASASTKPAVAAAKKATP